MKCGHCGATNSESAKFCGKCAFRLPASALNPQADPGAVRTPDAAPFVKPAQESAAAARQRAPAIQSPIDKEATVIRAPRPATAATPQPPLASASQGRANAIAHQADRVSPLSANAGAAALLTSTPPARRKLFPMLIIGLIVLALVSGFLWLRRGASPAGSMPPMPANAPTVTSAAPASATAGPQVTGDQATQITTPVAAPTAPEPAPTPETAAVLSRDTARLTAKPAAPEVVSAQKSARSVKAEKQKMRREAEQKRRAETDARRRQDDESRGQAADSARSRELESRARQDELARQGKTSSARRTPQQACADRSNFISRGLCESRECEKPEQAGLSFCVQMRERRAPKEVNY